MSDELLQDAKTNTYEDTKPLLYSTIIRFHQMYGGEFSDLESHAHELWVKAYDEDNGSSPFPVRLRFVIWNGLMDDLRKRARRSRYDAADVDETQLLGQSRSRFKLRELLEMVSDEARIVVRLMTNTPEELLDQVVEAGGEFRNYRSVIRRHLKQTKGLSDRRISELFEEIREAMDLYYLELGSDIA